jgi:hypothetical protein
VRGRRTTQNKDSKQTQNEDSKQMGRRRKRGKKNQRKNQKQTLPKRSTTKKNERENPNQKTKHAHKSGGASYTQGSGFFQRQKGLLIQAKNGHN